MSMYEKKPLAAAVSLALMALAAQQAYAQQAPAQAEGATQVVEVTGIRASMAKSLNVKRNSSANVEVVTAEDVGKMPDKNLADSLQRLAGVVVRTDYDEAEKVALRGTNPDMSLILFNGHTVSGGDWYVSDQQSSSRSTSLSLMPSSVLNQALVYKTSQANIVDGGLAGTINVTTRKPLAQKEKISGVVSVGASYADLPGKTAPDLNASINWKNEANTFGLIAQGFAEKRYVRRDSVSRFGYNSGWDVIDINIMKGITDASLAGTGLKASDLQGVRIPLSMSSEFVEGVRDRKGGMLSAQFKPNQDLDVTVTGFSSKMNANNYGRLNASAINSMLRGKGDPGGATTAAAANTVGRNGEQVFAQIRNPVIVTETTLYGQQLKVLKSADIVFPDGTPPQLVGHSENFYRDGASATSAFLDLDASYRVNNDLKVKTLVSMTRGVGETKGDQGVTYARYGTGLSYAFRGVEDAPFVQYYGTGPAKPGLNADGSGFKLIGRAISGTRTTDREASGQVDVEYHVEKGWLTTLESGLRYSDHKRFATRSGPALVKALDPNAQIAFEQYPGDFGNGLGGGFDNTGFYSTPEALKAYYASVTGATTPEFERRVQNEIDLRERVSAFYVMQNYDHEKWSGNFGLRFVRTQVNANIVNPVPAGKCQKTEPGKPVVTCAAYPGAITTASDGSQTYIAGAFNPNAGTIYYKTPAERVFNNVLPSVNVRYEVTPEMLVRFGASRTIGRQNYNIVGAGYGTPTCVDGGCTVSGPNPSLRPLTSDNVDLAWAWYFAPRSLISINAFHSKIDGYVKTGTIKQNETVDLPDPRDGVVKTFFVNTAGQQGARISGIELAYEQPLWGSFGMTSNISRAKTKVDDGRPMVGASDWAANLGGYFENDTWSARLVWNYRSEYVNSSTAPSPTADSQGNVTINGILMPVAPTMAKGVATLAASISYNIQKNLVLSLDATNLTNTKRAQYRYSEEEQQKVDVSGRQFYVNLKYKF